MASPNLTGRPSAGPNLTGWTSSSLAPKVTAPVPSPAAPPVNRVVNRPEFAGQFNSPTPQTIDKMRKLYEKQIKNAEAMEVQARATGDPVKLRHAYDLTVGAAAAKNWAPGHIGQSAEGLIAAKAFRDRNPTIEGLLSAHGKELLNNPLPPVAVIQAQAQTPDFSGVAGQQPIRGADAISVIDPEAAARARARSQFTNTVGPNGVGSLVGISSSGGVGPDAYNLSPSDYGAAAGPNPRVATAPQTPLEQLLGQMFPDMAGGGTDPMADPRNPVAGSSTFNNVIANLGAGGGAAAGGGWVPGPAGGGNGADIASVIPGAPPWLAGQINGLPGGGGGGGFFAPPASALDLAGLATLSAEQERQKAAQLKAQADRQASWQAQMLADQRRQQQLDQINRQRAGGVVSSSGWQSPTFKPTAWTPVLPAY